MDLRPFQRLFRLFALLLCLGASASADSVRIATYNLQNYLVGDRQIEAGWRPEYPKPESEKAIIREIIRTVQPDILVVQEIGSIEFLEELRGDLELEGLHYPYAIHQEGADPVRHIAMLSMLAPEAVVKHTDLEFKYMEGRESVKRGLLEARFDGPGSGSFTVFAVHLKSRWSDDPADPDSGIRRVREAEACRNRIIERTEAGGAFIIAGDFNDHPKSATLRRFFSRGSVAIGSHLAAADSRGEVWTHFYEKQGSYQSVDGFVLSSEIAGKMGAGVGCIVDLPGALSGSDHRMVYADIVFE